MVPDVPGVLPPRGIVVAEEPEVISLGGGDEEDVEEIESIHSSPVHSTEPPPGVAEIPEKNPFICKESLRCKKKFKTENELSKHIESWHNSEKKYKCQECSKAFHHMQGLKKHQEIHLRPAIHCKVCDEEVKTEYRLKQHMELYHTNKNLVCKICGKTFEIRFEQRKHEKSCFKKANKLKFNKLPSKNHEGQRENQARRGE